MLSSVLDRLLQHRNAPTWYVAFSGGVDSTALLHMLVELGRQHRLPPIQAIHVHHGLQTAADAWPQQCQAMCDHLAVPLKVIHVQVKPGASLEQAARDARYRALEQHLGMDDVLLTGQHRDDQAETFVFRLLRGAGVRGLAAMPRQRRLGQGWLVRPLLDCSRMQLELYVRQHELLTIEDPSNQNLRFSRNYLRHQVLPLIHQRWPQAAATIGRSSEHLREALGLLEEVADEDLQRATAPGPFDWLAVPSLPLLPLQRLSPARQRNALQRWLAPRTRLPDAGHWRSWEHLRDAREDAEPVWALAEGELRRGAGRLWWLYGPWLLPVVVAQPWPDSRQPLALPDNGHVTLHGPVPPGVLQVAYRQGGEILELPGRGRRDLKRLLNESGLPAFARGRLPLLFVDGCLHAVANLEGLSASAVQLAWSPPTSEQCLR